MKLLAKFNLILIVVFGICGLVIARVSYSYLIDNARSVAMEKAELLLASARSVRDYTAEDLSPLLQQNPRYRTHFLAETIPFFGATTTFDRLRKDYPDYAYKEAALNPTNPEDRASDWEADSFAYFRSPVRRYFMRRSSWLPSSDTALCCRARSRTRQLSGPRLTRSPSRTSRSSRARASRSSNSANSRWQPWMSPMAMRRPFIRIE